MRLLNNYKVILLDMNGTFMFGEDRFSESEDYYSTYLSIGGKRLSEKVLNEAIQSCYQGLYHDYENPKKYDDFPSLVEGFHLYSTVDESDIPDLVEVFALHELGHISQDYASFLKNLRCSHVLGLVANIWSPKNKWLSEFKRVGIDQIFSTMVFSSDSKSIKPSTRLFNAAFKEFNVEKSQVMFIGDSLKYDMEGAKKAGFTTVWINKLMKSNTFADYVIPNLLEIEKVIA